jgi:hypothetical protein
MKSQRRVFVAFLGILVITAAVHADMMPVSQKDTARRQSLGKYATAELQGEDLSSSFNCTSFTDLDLWPTEFLPEAAAGAGQNSEVQNLKILTNEPDSFKLCLSALISFGLCCWAPWIKRLSLGFIPEWYHEGGPFQIGYSHAVLPDTICPAPACCFIQPYNVEDNHLPRYFVKTVISLWRKSQFTQTVLASRGPPEMS